jgi:hypothetical protein
LEREHLASQLEQCKKTLDQVSRDITRSGSLDAMNDVETARKKLDKAVARFRYADRGYAGFFDAIKVDEQALERVYQFDLGLLSDVQAVRGAASASRREGGGRRGMITRARRARHAPRRPREHPVAASASQRSEAWPLSRSSSTSTTRARDRAPRAAVGSRTSSSARS